MTTHAHYSDLSRRRLVDLCVQRESLLVAALEALGEAGCGDESTARTIAAHVAEVKRSAQLRRGITADGGRA